MYLFLFVPLDMTHEGLWTDLLAFTLRLRKITESNRKETSHRLKWDPLPPNEVGGIAQQVREV